TRPVPVTETLGGGCVSASAGVAEVASTASIAANAAHGPAQKIESRIALLRLSIRRFGFAKWEPLARYVARRAPVRHRLIQRQRVDAHDGRPRKIDDGKLAARILHAADGHVRHGIVAKLEPHA